MVNEMTEVSVLWSVHRSGHMTGSHDHILVAMCLSPNSLTSINVVLG